MSRTVTGDQPAGARQGFLRGLIDRFGHLIHEVSKFATVGGVAFVIDFVLFNYCSSVLHIESLAAKTISTVVAATVAFLGNRFWTWRHRERANPARQYALFFVLNGIGLAIGLASLAASRYGLGAIWPGIFHTALADNIASFVVGMGLGTLFRFWSYRRFVFINTEEPAAATRRN